ncbi:DUF2871 domain-containing protein [Listeria fleischmannii]|uniref:DUF2871 domain-containing protein n=1 Tax=Listeria fleischmannii TaxID=1069827 RepID=A0A841YCE6_9LIST|nr:DUF2871 domain-containing protein [Listeria fleischmannii]EIA19914.1 hypothetical protein KKC_09827 [Listeria fleischmannii subsp. coloradonensis]MBC1397965.1 DUF2871 domain-containing protein [Listeria fleischmannii]MBC1426026.1 DUF2871 domain-containing protein [Listeria fleischmannii]STY34298.1 Protein of uncharacterised function (DUF2871) [Listeria fleischmannii subsp. coloradonensis]
MKKLLTTALTYCILGLIAGVYYREITKYNDFTGDTQLSVLHTHLLMLGMFMFIIVLLLEKNFHIMQSKKFNIFYYVYNAGLLLTIGLMTFHGTMTVIGKETGAAVAGIAGLGHILLAIGLIALFMAMYERLKLEK